MRRPRLGLPVLVGLVAALAAIPAGGAQRLVHTYDSGDGLPVSRVVALAQDSEGFIWVSTAGGLARFDGTEMRPWGTSTLKRNIDWLFPGPAGELLLLPEAGHTLFEKTPQGIAPVTGPDGAPFASVVHAAFTDDGRFWVARRHELFRRNSRRDAWIRVPLQLQDGEAIRRLRAGGLGELLLVTNRGLRSLVGDTYRAVWDSLVVGDAIRHPDGAAFVVEKPPLGARVLEIRNGRGIEILMLKGANANRFALRGRVAWLALDRALVALRPGEEPDVIGPESGLRTGGDIIVDREGSLWVGGQGLTQIPEPEALIFDERQGLPGSHTRSLLRTGEGLWVSTWQGLGLLSNRGGGWVAHTASANAGAVCEDRSGVLWTDPPRWKGGFHPLPVGDVVACSASADGLVWLVGSRGLTRTRAPGVLPVRVRNPFGDWYSGGQVLEDRRRRLWVSEGERICHADAAEVLRDQQPRWSCDAIEGVRDILAIAETPRGFVWAGGWGGLWQLSDSGWTRLEWAQKLAAPHVAALVPSPRGGMWVLGQGGIVRVLERPDTTDKWSIVERLSFWQGVPSSGGADIVEEPNGVLWVGTDLAGVVRVPLEARLASPDPPRMRLIDLRVDGENRDSVPRLQLPPGRNSLELRFAALSYRDRGRLRYQYRLRPDDTWQDSRDPRPVFRFDSLSSGAYSAEVRASLDGTRWSPIPARVDFEVLRPWYQTRWAVTTAVALTAALLFLAHRIRVATLLGLERQRGRIARDLHDEIGSGLGSIGILSGLAANPGVGDEQRLALVSRIAEASSELGTALADIVWSLRPDAGSLEALAYHLARRGSRLFPDDRPVFTTAFPEELPHVELPLPLRRNLLLIALEALHNVARHASATRVTLGLAPEGRNWRLWIADDGTGLNHKVSSGGVGLANMRQRTTDIGAVIDVGPGEYGGTRVTVVFSPARRRWARTK